MKKISVMLIISVIFSIFSVTAFAGGEELLSFEMSEIENGELTVSVYGENIQKLVGFIVRVEYDTCVFCYKNGKAAGYTDEDGNEYQNFSGLWDFGELKDSAGCAGAYISFNGVTKTKKTKMCEFTLGLTGEISSSTDIAVCVKELTTEDNNPDNDIYEIVKLAEKNYSVSYEDLFSFTQIDNAVQLTGCFFEAEMLKIPEKINGKSVASLAFSSPQNCSFAILPQSLKAISRGSLDSGAIIICAEGSGASAYAEENGNSVFTCKNKISATKNGIFVTEDFLIDDEGLLFGGDAPSIVKPSHQGYFGTGSEITLFNNEETSIFRLAVLGDLNGDSVCDALDVLLCERAASSDASLTDWETVSGDLDFNDEITQTDYQQLINKAIN